MASNTNIVKAIDLFLICIRNMQFNIILWYSIKQPGGSRTQNVFCNSCLSHRTLTLTILYDVSYPLNRGSDVAWPFPFSIKHSCLRPLGLVQITGGPLSRPPTSFFAAFPGSRTCLHAGSGPFQSMICSTRHGQTI